MKALLLKDGYVLYKQLKLFLLILIIFCTLPGISATGFSMIYVIMLPVSTLSYDEHSKWNQLAAMMPYTPRQMVVSKYVLGYIGAGCVVLLSSISSVAMSLISKGVMLSGLLTVMILLPCIGLLVLSVLLPMIIRLGSEKGRMLYLLAVGVMGAVTVLLPTESLPAFHLSAALWLPALILFTVCVNLLSISLSIRFYKRKMT